MFSLNALAGASSGALVDASFRGVRFDCLKAQDSAQRDQAMHEYPYRDGADVEDLGRKARRVTLSAMFWGRDYQQRLRQLVTALDLPGPGELVHPVFGSMPRAQLLDYQISHEADAPDSCTVEINWVEATPGNPFFAGQLPGQQIEAIAVLAARVRQLGGTAFIQVQGTLGSAGNALTRLNSLRQHMHSCVQQLGNLARQSVAQVTDLLTTPQAFVGQVGTLVDQIGSWRFGPQQEAWPQTSAKLELPAANASLADWNALRGQLSALPERIGLRVDELAGSQQFDPARIGALVQLQAATGLAGAAASLFHAETRRPTLTPPALEQVAADARTALQQTISAWRQAMPGEDSYAVIEPLRELGLQVQQGAASLIAAKPPMLSRRTETSCNLRQLAHLWYGDSNRADELLRLNPQLAFPNHLPAGELIHGYAH